MISLQERLTAHFSLAARPGGDAARLSQVVPVGVSARSSHDKPVTIAVGLRCDKCKLCSFNYQYKRAFGGSQSFLAGTTLEEASMQMQSTCAWMQ